MGKTFQKTKGMIKKLDPQLVSLGLSGALLGVVYYKPEYADQIEAALITIRGLLTDENITEEEFHNQLTKAMSDIGIDDPEIQVLIGIFLKKLDTLADKYLDVVKGEFTAEEREAWKQVLDDLIGSLKLYIKHRRRLVNENKSQISRPFNA